MDIEVRREKDNPHPVVHAVAGGDTVPEGTVFKLEDLLAQAGAGPDPALVYDIIRTVCSTSLRVWLAPPPR